MIGPFLFLDLDGVVNGHVAHKNKYCGLDKKCVEILNGILESTKAKIVLTSAWRYFVLRGEMTLKGLEGLLCTHGVTWGHLIDVLPEDVPDGNGGACRGTAVKEWFQKRYCLSHQVRYVAVDNMDLGYTKHGIPFVQTDGKLGLAGLDDATLDQIEAHLGH